MKTTELFIEQVAAGLMLLAVGMLPYLVRCPSRFLADGIGLEFGAAVLVAAYVLGVVVDRFSDSLLYRPAHYQRLLHARRIAIGRRRKAGRNARAEDPFPEDRIRAKVHSEDHGGVEWINYLRTRIRLSRLLAVMAPAITISLVLGLAYRKHHDTLVLIGFATMAIIYVATFCTVRSFGRNSKKRLLRSNDKDLKRAYKGRYRGYKEPTAIMFWALGFEGIGFAAYGIWRYCANPTALIVTLILGGMVTTSAYWSWIRILKTYYKFISAVDAIKKDKS